MFFWKSVANNTTDVGNLISHSSAFSKSRWYIYFCLIDYTKAFDCVDHNKLWKIFKRWEYQTTLPASQEICMQVKKQQLEPDMEQQTGFNWKRSMSRLYIVTLLIYLICKVHHVKCQAG